MTGGAHRVRLAAPRTGGKAGNDVVFSGSYLTSLVLDKAAARPAAEGVGLVDTPDTYYCHV